MYGKLPEVIGPIVLDCKEFMSYQYLPIKLAYPESSIRAEICNITLEPRLECFRELINLSVLDFNKNYPEEFKYSYIYLTAKRAYQSGGCGFNRSGYHSDGYGTLDVNYIWSDSQPTIFNTSKFNLSKDDLISLDNMELQAKIENEVTYPDNTLLRLDQYVIHKVGKIQEGVRTFVKISYSFDKYNLEGNSHNYELNYNWKMYPRNLTRNKPQRKS